MTKSLWMMCLISALSMVSLNAFAEWQCYARDKGGHMWKSEGSTEERATAVAMSFCSGYSPDSATCKISKCANA